MQGLTWEHGYLLARIVGQAPAPTRTARVAVERVADQRVAALAHMNPDLVGSAGRQAAFDRGGDAVEFPQHPVMGEGGPSGARQHPHLLAIRSGCRETGP